jgi:hypothetical protein
VSDDLQRGVFDGDVGTERPGQYGAVLEDSQPGRTSCRTASQRYRQ